MNLFVRSIAVLTVLLGIALMAVSVYAAKTASVAAAEQADVDASGESGVISDAVSEVGTAVSTVFAEGDSAVEQPEAARAPLRFAAPAVAAPAGLSMATGADLSTGARVWSVPSVRNGLFGVAGAGAHDVPPDQLVAMQQIGEAFGVPWQLLAAVAKVESDFGSNMATSSAGAIGYGQFLPQEWARYGAGGDPYNYRDALLAMARYLRVAGAPGDMAGAVYAYNHSWEYVELVLSYAAGYGYGASRSGASFIWPVFGPISSYFGPSHPLGIDIDQTAVPGAPVFAAHDGVVVFAGGDPCCSYGRYVIVAGGEDIATLYAHLDRIAVEQGQRVSQGTALGTSGCTGYCTGTHLHFEVIVAGARSDPLHYLPGGN
jgi:murein DD-endopeptidase MepM/ murein hydrolase activator NlpD